MKEGRDGGREAKEGLRKKKKNLHREILAIEQFRQISGSWAFQIKAIDNVSFLCLLLTCGLF